VVAAASSDEKLDAARAAGAAGAHELLSMVAAGKLRPRIGAVLPLERATDALKLLAGRRAVGKVIVQVTA
jgi:NADPH:quinone reductase